MLTIEKGIPIPSTKERKGENVELLRSMKPGDSVFFDAPIIKKATRFYRVAKKLGVAVVIRREGAGMRLWLVGNKTKEVAPSTTPTTKKGKAVVVKKAAAKKVAKKPVKKVKSIAAPSYEEHEAKKKAKASRDKRYRESKKAAKAAPVAASVAATAAEVPNG
jgi:hypothetical protein